MSLRTADPINSQGDLMGERAGLTALLTGLNAQSTLHAIGSVKAHLEGTYRILRTWSEDEDVCLAGLAHNLYSTDSFSQQFLSVKERDTLQGIIGERAERLVFLFGGLNRSDLLQRFSNDTAELTHRLSGEPLHVSRSDVRDLLTIHLANLAEQSCSPSGAPSIWLELASEYACSLRRLRLNCPPAACRDLMEFNERDEQRLLLSYESTLRSSTEPTTPAAADLAATITHAPVVGEPFLWLALLSFAAGDVDSAARFAEQGAAIIARWGTPWDKRLTQKQWLSMASMLQGCGTAEPASRLMIATQLRSLLHSSVARPEGVFLRLQHWGSTSFPLEHDGGILVALPPDDEDTRFERDGSVLSSSDFEDAPARFVEYIRGFRESDADVDMKRYPGLRKQPFWDPELFPIVRELEEQYPAILAELSNVARDLYCHERESIPRKGNWQVLFLYERGRRHEKTCEMLPITTSIVEHNRTIRTQRGLIYFSRASAKTFIAPHYGPTNMRLRCHLGIKVPRDCGMLVDGIANTWKEGRCLVFDDSFRHEVWNRSEDDRIVFIVDLWHPDLSDDEVEFLSGLDAHIVGLARGLRTYWLRNEGYNVDPSDASPLFD